MPTLLKNNIFFSSTIALLCILLNVSAFAVVVPKEDINSEGISPDRLNKILKICESGDNETCESELFPFYNFGDMQTVIAISERMCELGRGSYCTDLGTYYTNGIKGTKYDFKKGYHYYKRGCELRSELGCKGLREYSIVKGKVIHNSRAKIGKITAKCEGGDLDACVDLGYIYHHGIGTAVDTKSALKFYKKGCNTKKINFDRRCEGLYQIMEANESL